MMNSADLQPQSPPSPGVLSAEPQQPQTGIFHRLGNWFFGYDYFLAHRSGDGKAYAVGLYDALTAKGNELSCFLDVKHFGAGGNLTYMQTAALRKTTRLIVLVTPLAHAIPTETSPNHLLNEVREFKRQHPAGAIVPIGTRDTLSRESNPGSLLLDLIPHYPDDICVIETAETLTAGKPSPETTAKLLNDFTEERHSTRRLRWMRRFAGLLVVLLGLAGWQWFRAQEAGEEANRKLAEVNWQLGQQARGSSFSANEVSPVAATWHLFEAARASLRAGDLAGSSDATRAALAASSHLKSTLVHPDSYEFLASPDDKRVLTWGENGEIWIWDAVTGALLFPLPAQPEGLRRVIFSGSGRLILTLDEKGLGKIWNAETGQAVGQPMPHGERLEGGAFNSAETQLVTWSAFDGQRRVRVWNATTGLPEWAQTFDNEFVKVGFEANGQSVAVIVRGHQLTRWDARNGTRLGEALINQHLDSKQFSEDGSRVLHWMSNGTVGIWETATDKAVARPVVLQDEVMVGVISPKGDAFFTHSYDSGSKVHVLNAREGKFESYSLQEPEMVDDAMFSPDGRNVLVWTNRHVARLWDVRGGDSAGEPMRHLDYIEGAAFSEDGKRILTWTFEDNAYLWDKRGQPIGYPMKSASSGRIFRLSRDGRRVFTEGEGGTWHLWEPADGTTVTQKFKAKYSSSQIAFSKDGQKMVTREENRSVQLWNAITGSPIGSPVAIDGTANDMSFSPDGRWALIRTYDGNALFLDAQTGSPAGRIMRQENPLASAVLSDDGGRIATWSKNGRVVLWDGRTRSVIGDPFDQKAVIHSGLFGMKGERLILWNRDGHLRIWNTASVTPCGEPIRIEKISDKPIYFGDRMLMSDDDKKVFLFDLSEGRLIAEWPHPEDVGGAVLDSEAKLAATWDFDGSLNLWDARTGARLAPPLPHEEGINAAMFSKDGKKILTWDGKGFPRWWNSENGEALGEGAPFPTTTDEVIRHETSGNVLAIQNDGTAQIWSGADCQFVRSISLGGGPIDGAAFSQDGKQVFAWNYDGARLWKVESGTSEGVALPHEGLQGASFNTAANKLIVWDNLERVLEWDGVGDPVVLRKVDARIQQSAIVDGEVKLLATDHTDNSTYLIDPTKDESQDTEFEHDSKIAKIRFDPAGKTVLTVFGNGSAQLWDPATGAPVGPPMKYAKPVSSIEFNRTGDRIGVRSSKEFSLWSSKTGELIGDRFKSETALRDNMAFSPTGEHVMVRTSPGEVHVFRTDTGAPSMPSFQHPGSEPPVFSHDGKLLLTWSGDGRVTLRKLEDGSVFGSPISHGEKVRGAVFSEDDRSLITWDEAGAAKLWDSTTGKTVIPPLLNDADLRGAAFLQAGRRILTWTNEVARLWDRSTGKQIGRTVRADSGIKEPMISEDESLLLLRSAGKVVKTWSIAQGTLVHRFDHSGLIESVRFNADHSSVIAMERDNSTWQWNVKFDRSMPLDKRIQEFEVRSATTFDVRGKIQPLTREAWLEKVRALKGE